MNINTELDLKSIDQLHGAIIHISRNSFELKRLCLSLLVGAATLIVSFADSNAGSPNLNGNSFWIGALIIVASFWILDAQSYYYQLKLRRRMNDLARDVVDRSPSDIYPESIGMPLPLEEARSGYIGGQICRRNEDCAVRGKIGKSLHIIWKMGIANGSMLFYYIMIAIALLSWVGCEKDWLGLCGAS